MQRKCGVLKSCKITGSLCRGFRRHHHHRCRGTTRRSWSARMRAMTNADTRTRSATRICCCLRCLNCDPNCCCCPKNAGCCLSWNLNLSLNCRRNRCSRTSFPSGLRWSLSAMMRKKMMTMMCHATTRKSAQHCATIFVTRKTRTTPRQLAVACSAGSRGSLCLRASGAAANSSLRDCFFPHCGRSAHSTGLSGLWLCCCYC